MGFIYLWLCWVFVSVQGLSLVAASGGHSSSRCTGLSRPLLLWNTGSRCAGSVIVAHGPSGSAACGIFPDQGSNPCPLHQQAVSQPLRHRGSPKTTYLFISQYQRNKNKMMSQNRHYIFCNITTFLWKCANACPSELLMMISSTLASPFPYTSF